jgi:natural product precursor
MKKKNVKTEKLKLNRETLRNLEESDLRAAAGGNSIQLSCDTVTWHCATVQSNCC